MFGQMIYANHAELRGLVRLGMAHDPAKQRELLSAQSFVLADVDFAVEGDKFWWDN